MEPDWPTVSRTRKLRHRFKTPGIYIVNAQCEAAGRPITQKQKVIVHSRPERQNRMAKSWNRHGPGPRQLLDCVVLCRFLSPRWIFSR